MTGTKISRRDFIKILLTGIIFIILGFILRIPLSRAIPNIPIPPHEPGEEKQPCKVPIRIDKFYPDRAAAGDRVRLTGPCFNKDDKVYFGKTPVNSKLYHNDTPGTTDYGKDFLAFTVPTDVQVGTKIDVKISRIDGTVSNTVQVYILGTFHMVVFGDSIPWGQGLLNGDKYSSLVANKIQEEGNSKVVVEMRAHSGAKIGYSGLSADDVKECPHDFGEIPTTWPTILQQVDQFNTFPVDEVDLVLLGGGINDIGVFNLLIPFVKPVNEIRELTQRYCHDDMKVLLTKLTEKFTNPKTKIIVTGYFQHFSQDTDILAIADFLSFLGATIGSTAGPLGSILGTIIGEIVGVAGTLAAKSQMIENSKAFATTSSASLNTAVIETDGGRGRIFFANPEWKSENAMFASKSYVYGINLTEAFLSGRLADIFGGSLSAFLEDPIILAQEREKKCKERIAGCITSPVCAVASIGHPNQKGAQAYADAIYSTWVRSNTTPVQRFSALTAHQIR